MLHGTMVERGGVASFGIGGGIPTTPFGSWSWDFTEDEARRLLANCPADAVVVSHSPPKGAVDVSSRGVSLGSVAFRDHILAGRHPLVVCGHIHESAGRMERVGETPVVNAGPAGFEWELG